MGGGRSATVLADVDFGELGESWEGRQAWGHRQEIPAELARTKRELAEVKMERDILKKAAAYFAKESLPGTR
jgi:transposase-like protein